MFQGSLCPSSGEQMASFSGSSIRRRRRGLPTYNPLAHHPLWTTLPASFTFLWPCWCPKHVETEVNNKHLIVASCWFFSLHTLLTMHGHRNVNDTGSVVQRGWWASGFYVGRPLLLQMLDPENEATMIFEKVRNYTPTWQGDTLRDINLQHYHWENLKSRIPKRILVYLIYV